MSFSPRPFSFLPLSSQNAAGEPAFPNLLPIIVIQSFICPSCWSPMLSAATMCSHEQHTGGLTLSCPAQQVSSPFSWLLDSEPQFRLQQQCPSPGDEWHFGLIPAFLSCHVFSNIRLPSIRRGKKLPCLPAPDNAN